MTEDELITAYVDGQLSAQERAALEARAHGDAALSRRIAATQLVAREAQQLPAVAVPRNFILPRDVGAKPAPAPERRRGPLLPTWLLRFGSLAAAGAFALVIAVELFQAPAPAPVMPANAPMAAPMAAPANVITPVATVLAKSPSARSVAATAAATAVGAPALGPDVTALALPETETRMLPAETNGAAAASAMTASGEDGADALALTATPEPLAVEAASAPLADAQPQATAAPAQAPAPPPSPSAPALTPLRMFGLLALLAAIVLGALGWLRR